MDVKLHVQHYCITKCPFPPLRPHDITLRQNWVWLPQGCCSTGVHCSFPTSLTCPPSDTWLIDFFQNKLVLLSLAKEQYPSTLICTDSRHLSASSLFSPLHSSFSAQDCLCLHSPNRHCSPPSSIIPAALRLSPSIFSPLPSYLPKRSTL